MELHFYHAQIPLFWPWFSKLDADAFQRCLLYMISKLKLLDSLGP